MKILRALFYVALVVGVFIGAAFFVSILNFKDNSKALTDDSAWQAPALSNSNTNSSVPVVQSDQDKQDEAFLATQPVKPQPKGSIRVPILLYHHIEKLPSSGDTSYYVSPEIFEQQMAWLAANNYQVISLNALVNYLKTGQNKPASKSIVITFDDGTIGEYQNAFPILKKYHYPATSYIVPTWIDKGSTDKNSEYMSWPELKEMSDYGIDIGSHNYSHYSMNLDDQVKATFEATESKKILEQKLNRKIVNYAYPGGSYIENSITIVKNAGYVSATSTEKNIDHNQAELYHLGRMHIDNDMPYFKARIEGKWFK